jgi:hypothetical protein
MREPRVATATRAEGLVEREIGRRAVLSSVVLVLVALARPSAADPEPREVRVARAIERARSEVRSGVVYDRRYVERAMGAPAEGRGACTDLVARALGASGYDVQTRLQLDVRLAPSAYPGILSPDGRVDHRRTPNLFVLFRRTARSLPVDIGPDTRSTFAAGDVIVWTYGRCPECKADHIGLVSDRLGTRGLPLVLHNAGPRATEEDALDAWPIVGHFRLFN